MAISEDLAQVKAAAIEEIYKVIDTMTDYQTGYRREFKRAEWQYLEFKFRRTLYEEVIEPWYKKRLQEISSLNFSNVDLSIEVSLRGVEVPFDEETAFDMGGFNLEAFGYAFKIEYRPYDVPSNKGKLYIASVDKLV
ncbi:MAG: hypothetical protein JWN75_64 [Candidatus Saccharibacteria bacterium]|nr:hypothetical protein [Candidatus Saccharibacteria bacterium]